MKTLDQIKSEIISYLTKTSSHTFVSPKVTTKYTPNGVERKYDYENGTYFKVIKKGDNFYTFEGNKDAHTMRKIDIDYYIKYYGNNAKCVLKHSLFLNKNMKSIKSTKFVKEQISEILDKNTKKELV